MIYGAPHIKEVEYVMEHLRPSSLAEVRVLWDGSMKDYARHVHRTTELLWVVYADRLPAAIVGAAHLHGDVWGSIGLATEEWPKVWRSVVRVCRRQIKPALIARGAKRLQAAVPSNMPDRDAWLTFLGGRKEAVLEQYGLNGEDVAIFAWVEGKDVLSGSEG